MNTFPNNSIEAGKGGTSTSQDCRNSKANSDNNASSSLRSSKANRDSRSSKEYVGSKIVKASVSSKVNRINRNHEEEFRNLQEDRYHRRN